MDFVQSGFHVVVLAQGGAAPAPLLQQLKERVGGAGSVASATSLDHVAASSLDAVIEPELVRHTASYFSAVAKALKPGGTLLCNEPVTETNPTRLHTVSSLRSALVLAGFVDLSLQSVAPNTSARESFGADLSAVVGVRCCNPAWAHGQSQSLSFGSKKKDASPAQQEEGSSSPAVWTLGGDDLVDEEVDMSSWQVSAADFATGVGPVDASELADDDALLHEEDLIQAVDYSASQPDDCDVGVSGKRACKNCTCGRAEAESKKAVPIASETVKSSCGNCFLGDAFRCAGCPSLGLPPFKPGEKVSISLE